MTPALPPPVDEQLLSDYVFGLLEPSEAAQVEEYVRTDPAWEAAHAREVGFQTLLNSASRSDFSEVQFRAPEQSQAQKTLAEVKAGASGGKKTRDPDRGVSYGIWVRYAVAASLFLAICGLAAPMLRDLGGFLYYRPEVASLSQQFQQSEDSLKVAEEKLQAARKSAQSALNQERAKLDQLFNDWLAASRREREAFAKAPFRIAVKGPVSAMPGIPNDYALLVESKPSPDPIPEFTAQVKSSDGKVLYQAVLPNLPDRKFTVPATIWSQVTANSGLTLEVLAKDRVTGQLSPVRTPVNLFEPIFTTYLSTDKPLYKPGEKIYFRTLTLEQSRLLPPEKEQTFQYELLGPDGRTVPGVRPILGLTKPVQETPEGFAPILGPDGKPLKGIGSGMFQLPSQLPGGVYKLLVTEATPDGFVPPMAPPVAVRRITVAGYNPDRLQKTLDFSARSYGPGETVTSKLSVKDQVRSVASARVEGYFDADGTIIKFDSTTTDDRGQATIQFALPKKADLQKVTLTVRLISGGVVESIVRPVPIRTAKLQLEFFPEASEHLVAKVPNRVYFRVRNIYGEPADCSGTITDGEKTVASFQTLRDAEHPGVNQGLGVCEFTPEPGKTYTAKLTTPQGVTQPAEGYKLPKVVTTGLAMRLPAIVEPGQPLTVKLAQQGEKRKLLIGAYVRGRPLVHEKVELAANQSTEVKLDLGQSPLGGVLRVTVFEERDGQDDLVPLAERLIFRQPVAKLNLKLTDPQAGTPYSPAQAVNLRVQASNEAGQPIGAILWAAVVNQSVLTQANDKTERLLPTHFLLNGELDSGDQLEYADFLLTSHPKAVQGLDLVLGTQGWRRFVVVPKKPGEPTFTLSQSRPPSPSSLIRVRPPFRSAVDEYWPKYEAAALRFEKLEKQFQSGEAYQEELSQHGQLQSTLNSLRSNLKVAADSLWFFQRHLEDRLEWLPFTMMFIGPMLLFCGLGYFVLSGSDLQRTLGRSALGFVALLGLSLLGTLLPSLLSDNWKRQVPEVTQRGEYSYRDRYGRSTYGPSAAPKSSATVPTASMPPMKEAGPRVQDASTVPDRLPAETAPVALGTPEAREMAAAPVPFGPRGINRSQPPQLDPSAPMNPAVARLQRQLDWLSEADRSSFLSVPKSAPLVVRSFAYSRESLNPPGTPVRSDFSETLYWQPVLVVQPGSQAPLSFETSDSISPYRVIVAGHTLDGRLGAVTQVLEVRKPFAVQPKLPLEVSSSDKLTVPMVLMNDTAANSAKLAYQLTGLRSTDSANDETFPISPGTTRKLARFEPTKGDSIATLGVSATNSLNQVDRVSQGVRVVADGFPLQGNESLMLADQANVNFTLPAWLPNSLKVEVTVYPNTLTQLQAGLEGLLREPHGCFEQSSSSNYPNVLVMDYLRGQGQANHPAAMQARDLLQRGYTKLTSFECPKTGASTRIGYEWFGAADRQHEALSAYGLLQFTDMSRVYDVDQAMLQRTKQFLLDSRDGQGGFRRTSASVDRFGSAPDFITNAYILWAITESEKNGTRTNLKTELDAMLRLAGQEPTSKDPYFLALMANALQNQGRSDDALKLLAKLAKSQAKNGSLPGATTSITRSTGRDLLIETTALALLGWLKAAPRDEFSTTIPAAITWLTSQRGPSGSIGGTQATVLALKALVLYAQQNQQPIESPTFTIRVNGREYGTHSFRGDSAQPLTFELNNAETIFTPGDNLVQVLSNGQQRYPMSVNWSCRSLQPRNTPDCPIQLATTLNETTVTEGNSVQMNVSVKNLQAKTQGMTVAVIGLPAGLKLPDDRAELKQLTAIPKDGAEPQLSYWEQNGRELVLYWRGLAENQTVNLSLTLMAEFPGEYRGPASRAYLYYGSEHRHWIAPLQVKINAK